MSCARIQETREDEHEGEISVGQANGADGGHVSIGLIVLEGDNGQNSNRDNPITAIIDRAKVPVHARLQRGLYHFFYAWNTQVEIMTAVDLRQGLMRFEVIMIPAKTVPPAVIVVTAVLTALSDDQR